MKARIDYEVPGPRVARVALEVNGDFRNRFVVFRQEWSDDDGVARVKARAAYVARYGEPRPGQRIVSIELLGAPVSKRS